MVCRFTIILIVIVILFTTTSHAQSSGNSKRLDSLFNELKKNRADTTLAKINCKIAFWYVNHGEVKTAMPYLNRALAIALKNNFDPICVKANKQIGYVFYDMGEMDSSLKYFNRALSFIHYDTPDYYDVYNGLGTVLIYKGNFVKSYEYYLKSLKLAEMSGKQTWIAKSYGNVGVALKEQMKLDDALIFFQKALEIAQKNKLQIQTYVSLTNIGNIYSEKFTRSKSKYDVGLALNYYLKAKGIVMDLVSNEKDRSNAITLLGNIGNTYADIHEYDKALVAFKEALDLMGDEVYLGSKSMLYNNLASVYIELQYLPETEKFLKLAKADAEENTSPADLMEIYRNYALYSELKSDYKNAYLYELRFKKISDSLFSTEVAEKRKEIELNAEYSKKDAVEKEQRDKKEALAKEEKHRQLLFRNALILGFILMGLVAFLIFRSYRIKQKSNEIILKQKQEVEKQKDLVEAKQKEIVDSIHYAKRIQQSLLPTKKYIEKNLGKLKKESN